MAAGARRPAAEPEAIDDRAARVLVERVLESPEVAESDREVELDQDTLSELLAAYGIELWPP